MKRKAFLSVGVGVCAAAIGYGQFLSIGPQVVFDPEAVAQIIKTIEQAVKEYNLLFQTYQTTQNTYNVLLNAANMIAGKYGWQYITAPLIYPTSHDAYGTSGGWMGALNGDLGVIQAYEQATMRTANPYALVSNLSTLGQNDFATHNSTIELTDGSAQQAMAVTGAMRARAAMIDGALGSLESRSLSDDPTNNTEVGVLNTISGAGIAGVRTQQDTNNLLAAIADSQTVGAKARRDLLVQGINDAIATQAAVPDTIKNIWDGDTAAHAARIP
jgi:hypothetical protein